MNVTLIIKRFDPEKDAEPREQVFRLQAEADERLLDLLERVRDQQDPALAFRSCCGQGTCGSDAMRINGKNRLACRVRVGDLKSREIHISPLPGFRVLRDLVIDLEPFHAHTREVLAALNTGEPASPQVGMTGPEPGTIHILDLLGSCIFCAACTSACPVYLLQPGYLGPAALAQAWPARSAGYGAEGGMLAGLLDQPNGAWGCRSAGACSEACPQGIPITRLLAEMKRAL